MNNREQNDCSRNRATTRAITFEIPGAEKRPQTPDSFERDFYTFFRKNSSNLFKPPLFDNDSFSDFSTRHFSNLYHDLQDIMPDTDPSPELFDYPPVSPHFNINSPSFRARRNLFHSSGQMPQSPKTPLTNSLLHHQQNQSPGRGSEPQFFTNKQHSLSQSHSQNPEPARKNATSVGIVVPMTQSFLDEVNIKKHETNLQGAESQEDLRTHGPSYTMFKIDNPQMEISEEFPNRERIKKLSTMQQTEQQDQSDVTDSGSDSQHYNIYTPDSADKNASIPDNVLEDDRKLPDWQARVQVTEGFCKRHLSARRKRHTIYVEAKKITESLQGGRKQFTREWRVVAPEIIDTNSIKCQFNEDENRLIITGYFDITNELAIH